MGILRARDIFWLTHYFGLFESVGDKASWLAIEFFIIYAVLETVIAWSSTRDRTACPISCLDFVMVTR